MISKPKEKQHLPRVILGLENNKMTTGFYPFVNSVKGYGFLADTDSERNYVYLSLEEHEHKMAAVREKLEMVRDKMTKADCMEYGIIINQKQDALAILDGVMKGLGEK